MLALPVREGIRRADRDNTIDVYISDDYLDVLRDGAWQQFFTLRPEPLTREEKAAWLATMGGVSMVLYGMISAVGVRNIVENQVDFTNSRNVIIAAIIMVLAIGVNYSGAVTFSVGSIEVSLSGLAVAAIAGIALNAVLPGKDYEFGEDEKGDTSVNFQV